MDNVQPHEMVLEANPSQGQLPRIVIIGAGFSGIAAARALRRCKADVVVIDRRNHHIFQPLLYQVATAVLSPAEVAAPIRQLVEKQANLSVMMAEVVAIDLEARSIGIQRSGPGVSDLTFDYLIISPGVRPGYFGHDEFARHAPGLKTIADAEAIRGKILAAYERAELADDPRERARQMTFVLVGAGPTGVELAASIAQMATITLRSNFRRIDPAQTSILLLDGAPRILSGFAESLADKAASRLARLGVTVVTGAMVEQVDAEGVVVGGHRIDSATVLWTAGVSPSPLIKMLGARIDRAGRVCVDQSLGLPAQTGVFVVGDAAAIIQDGRPVPGVAQAAIQQGRHVGRVIASEIQGKKTPPPFRYSDKGNMAVVGRNFAVLERGSLRLSGFTVWVIWAVLHVMFLPQMQNRLRVQTQWLWSYFTGQRSSRLIPEAPHAAE